MVGTIRLRVEVSNLDSGETKSMTLPCNLRAELIDFHDCVILSVSPDIPLGRNDDIERLNDVLDEINSENPAMDEDYLDILMEASPTADLFNEEFVRRLKENDFMFENLSGCCFPAMTDKERAGCYMATELMVPFDQGVTDDMLVALGEDALADYICWELIWEQYETMGFKLIERRNPLGKKNLLYIVHIK